MLAEGKTSIIPPSRSFSAYTPGPFILLTPAFLLMQAQARRGVRVCWYLWLIKVRDNRKKMRGGRMKDSKSERVMWMLLLCLMVFYSKVHMEKNAILSHLHIYVCSHDIYLNISFVLSRWSVCVSQLLSTDRVPAANLEAFRTFPPQKWRFWVTQIGFTQAPKNLLVSNPKLLTADWVL